MRASEVEKIVGLLDEQFGDDVHGHKLLDELLGRVRDVHLDHTASLTASLAKVVLLLDVTYRQ